MKIEPIGHACRFPMRHAFCVLFALTLGAGSIGCQTSPGRAGPQAASTIPGGPFVFPEFDPSGGRVAQSKLFAAERKRVEKDFQLALLAAIREDANCHYWAAVFLVEDEYLHGQERMPELALLLCHQGIALCRKQEEDMELVGFLYQAALIGERMGLHATASEHKWECETLCQRRDVLRGGIPVVSDEDRALYDAIRPAPAGESAFSHIRPWGEEEALAELRAEAQDRRSGTIAHPLWRTADVKIVSVPVGNSVFGELYHTEAMEYLAGSPKERARAKELLEAAGFGTEKDYLYVSPKGWVAVDGEVHESLAMALAFIKAKGVKRVLYCDDSIFPRKIPQAVEVGAVEFWLLDRRK